MLTLVHNTMLHGLPVFLVFFLAFYISWNILESYSNVNITLASVDLDSYYESAFSVYVCVGMCIHVHMWYVY